MMPWSKRRKEAQRAADEAERRAEEAKADWPYIRAEVNKARELRSANGWTETIAGIFGGRA